MSLFHPARKLSPWVVAALLLGCPAEPDSVEPTSSGSYETRIEEWRTHRDERLRAPDGWLSLVGLSWLEPGQNECGSGPDNDVQFPAGRVADRVATFILDGETVSVRPAPGIPVMLNGEPIAEQSLASDDPGPPDVLELDELRFYVIKRGERFGIRVKDSRSEVLVAFAGMDYFPIDPAYRVDATFTEWDAPREVPVATVTGGVQTMYSPGSVEFELGGETMRLMPLVYALDDEDYFYIFKDETTGKETYGAGRFLYGPRAKDAVAVIDFNKAYNPPCVFTPYATCPLPPAGNELPVRVEAGEKNFAHH